MEEKDILRISIIGRVGNEYDVRCDIESKYYLLIAGVICEEMKRNGTFLWAMKNTIDKFI